MTTSPTTSTPTTYVPPSRPRSWRVKGDIGNPPETGFTPVDDAVREVAEKRAAVVPLRAAADEAFNLANADGLLPSERAQLDLTAQDAAEQVRRAEAEVAAAVANVAAVARDHRDDVASHADAIKAKARSKSTAALRKLEAAERERREADSLAEWLRAISTGVVQFRAVHDATGAHLAAIEDAITGPQRRAEDYARIMEWLDANHDRVLPPLAAASMFPQLVPIGDVARMLGVDVTTAQAAYAEHRRRRRGGD